MICPFCGSESRVVDTGTSDTEIIRRRKCAKCDKVFYTSEKAIRRNTGSRLIVEYKKAKFS